MVPNGQLGDRSTDRNNLELCLPSSCFCPPSQKVAQALQTFLTVLLRVRWQVWNIAAWRCVSVGNSDGLDCPLWQQDKGSYMALCPFKGKKEYEYFLHSKVCRAGFLLARSTLQFQMCFLKLSPLPPLWSWSVLMTGTVPRAPSLKGMMINKGHRKACEILFSLKEVSGLLLQSH